MVLRSHPKPFSLKAATGPNPSIRSATRPQVQLRTVTGQRPDPHPASSSMCDCTGTFWDEVNQQSIKCTGCQNWRTGDGRCNVEVGQKAKKAHVRLCSFCHELLMGYFKKSWWNDPPPFSALPPPRPPVPAEAAEEHAEERAAAVRQASSLRRDVKK